MKKKRHAKTLRVIIAEPDVERRGRLREALRDTTDLRNFDARSLKEVTTILSEEGGIDLIFISSSFEREPIKKFLADRDRQSSNKQTPVILTLQANAQAAPFVTEMYSLGVLGFVIEPFSVNALRDIVSLVTADNRDEGGKKRADSVTTSFLLGDAAKHFEKLVQLRLDGKQGGGYLLRDLRDDSAAMRDTAASLSPDELGDLLLAHFSKAEPRALKLGEGTVTTKRAKAAPHPGIELSKVMRERKVTKEKFIATAKFTEAELEQIIQGELDLTEEMSGRISRAVGRSKEYWFGLQKKFSAYRDSLLAAEDTKVLPGDPVKVK